LVTGGANTIGILVTAELYQ